MLIDKEVQVVTIWNMFDGTMDELDFIAVGLSYQQYGKAVHDYDYSSKNFQRIFGLCLSLVAYTAFVIITTL